ncbi:MAG: hypothetical protein Q8P88_01125 [Candidatus Jorgensenbacteria bacterium]|nr:hypothetical protein [Candidatus Jorgensenbacteria bacterium]
MRGQALRPIQFIQGRPEVFEGRQRSGQATLSFILLVSGVILEVAIAGSFVAYFFSASGFGERVSARALAAARAGLEDAQIQVARNKEYGTGSTVQYSFSVGDDVADVTVSRTTDSAHNTYLFSITAVGTAFTRERKLVATMVVDQTTGIARLQVLREQAID